MLSVFGLYENPALAEQAVDHLTAAQLASGNVSVLMRVTVDASSQRGTLGLLTAFGPIRSSIAGPLLAAGPIRNSLDHLEETTPAECGVTLEDSLKCLGLPEKDAQTYSAKLDEGCVLLSVQCETADDVERASSVLDRTGALVIAPARENSAALGTIAGKRRMNVIERPEKEGSPACRHSS